MTQYFTPSKLGYYDIGRDELPLFESYLFDRLHIVRVGDQRLDQLNVSRSVPQGVSLNPFWS